MQHIIFDVDDTLLKSSEFDTDCYFDAVKDVLGVKVDYESKKWKSATDSGVLFEIIESIGLSNDKYRLHDKVKANFLERIFTYIKSNSIHEIRGAAEFLESLKRKANIAVSIATGGWHESAMLKLDAAGININGISIASSNDHHIRSEIMKIAVGRADKGSVPHGYTYFGDALWDKRACEELGFDFVLVGNKTDHPRQIEDFSKLEEIMALLDHQIPKG